MIDSHIVIYIEGGNNRVILAADGDKGEASLQHVREVLGDLRLEDEYKAEFVELADELDWNSK